MIRFLTVLLFAVAVARAADTKMPTIDAAAMAKVLAVTKMKKCAETTRAVLADCVKLLAKNDNEMKACAQEFAGTFPACFSAAASSKGPVSPEACQNSCWASYASCTGYSKGAAEHFTCWNYRSTCKSKCDKSDDVEKLYARVFAKRTVESCLSKCEGFGDACLGQANEYTDYTLCIFSKDTCRSNCYNPAK